MSPLYPLNQNRVRHELLTRTLAAKGRNKVNGLKGEDSNYHVLTSQQVKDIRQRYATEKITQEALGKEYGIHQTHVSDIVRYRLWKHIK